MNHLACFFCVSTIEPITDPLVAGEVLVVIIILGIGLAVFARLKP